MNLATRCVNGVCLCVLPRPMNDWRPLALRHRPLAFASSLLVVIKALALLAVAVTPTTAELSTITVARVVQLTNAERQKEGRGLLSVNPLLTLAAQRKGEDMLANDYFAHISPSGVTPWFWMQQEDYAYQIAGENLAIDFVEVEGVVAAWMASPSHRENMLHEAYTETGVAVVSGEFQGGTSTVVVHMFGLPASGATKKDLPSTSSQPNLPGTAGIKQTSPTPTPTASALPLPSPAPDTTAPSAPRIALAGGGAVVAKTINISVRAEVNTTVTVEANKKPLIFDTPTAPLVTLDVSHLPDGPLELEAFVKDQSGNISARSISLNVIKDATGPILDRSETIFVLGPQTDAPIALAEITGGETVKTIIEDQDGTRINPQALPLVVPVRAGEIKLAITDEVGNSSNSLNFNLLPQYAVEVNANVSAAPNRLNKTSRGLIVIVFMLVTLLLSLAIFVKISIQRPALIVHASFVMILASALFLW